MQRLPKLERSIRNDAGVGAAKKVRPSVKSPALKRISAAGRVPLRKFAQRRQCFGYPVSDKLAGVAASEDHHGLEMIISARPPSRRSDQCNTSRRRRQTLYLFACDTWRAGTVAHCAPWTNPDRGVRRGRPRGPGCTRLDREIYSVESGDTDLSQRVAWRPEHTTIS